MQYVQSAVGRRGQVAQSETWLCCRRLPEKTEAPPLPVYPTPLVTAPTSTLAGQKNMIENGDLPNMSKQLP